LQLAVLDDARARPSRDSRFQPLVRFRPELVARQCARTFIRVIDKSLPWLAQFGFNQGATTFAHDRSLQLDATFALPTLVRLTRHFRVTSGSPPRNVTKQHGSREASGVDPLNAFQLGAERRFTG
jgi:hypothetical protein